MAAQDATKLTSSAVYLRTAMRMLERALGEGEEAEEGLPVRPKESGVWAKQEALIVTKDGRYFTPPGGKMVNITRRRALRRMLAALAERRNQAPGEVMTIDELLQAGWPDERVLPEAGINRVYKAIQELRDLGLREILLNMDNGYLLEPTIPIVLS